MQSIPILEIDHFIGKFQVKAQLGQGSYGAVYQVIDPNGQIYALKCIFKSRFKEVNGWVGKLIMNEVDALKKLENQFIVNLITTFDNDYQGQIIFCILLEFCDGGNLLEYLLKRIDTFNQQNAIIFFKQILQGMKEIHQKRIIHRDLKLPNILIHKDQVKIADFGFCHIIKSDTSQINLNLGTLGTQAPEIMDNQPYGLKSDMFSIGVILYQLLFLAYPFSVDSQEDFLKEVTNQNPPSFQKNGRQTEKYLEDILTKMLQKDPARRLDWPDLFKSKLFQNSYSQIFGLSTIDDENEIDPVQSYIFYHQQICADYVESTVKKIEQGPILLDLQSQISFLNYTQEFSYKIYHRQILMCLFPCFLIHKQLYQKQQQYQEQNKNKVYDLPNTHLILTYQHQVVMANHDKLKKLNIIQENWEPELINLSLTPQFLIILKEVILKYLTNLRQEILKDTEEQKIDWQQILMFENDIKKSQIQQVLQKIKFFVLIHKVLFLEELEKKVFDQLVNNTQNNFELVIYIYQNIKLS